jgi:RNA polymerase sigma-70 factor (ECF subfamily)
MPGITDEELMMRYQAGNAVAYEMLCERYRTPVFGFIYRMLGNDRGPVEDLLQDIFVKMAGAAHLYEPRAKFSTWLFTIVRNHCCNYLKSKHFLQSGATFPIDAPGADGDEAVPSREVAAAADTVREVENRETGAILEAAIQRLPDMYREVFLLRAVQGVSHEDAARILGQKPATVRTHYHRAREILRADVSPLFGERPVGSSEGQCQ